AEAEIPEVDVGQSLDLHAKCYIPSCLRAETPDKARSVQTARLQSESQSKRVGGGSYRVIGGVLSPDRDGRRSCQQHACNRSRPCALRQRTRSSEGGSARAADHQLAAVHHCAAETAFCLGDTAPLHVILRPQLPRFAAIAGSLIAVDEGI